MSGLADLVTTRLQQIHHRLDRFRAKPKPMKQLYLLIHRAHAEPGEIRIGEGLLIFFQCCCRFCADEHKLS